MGVKLCSLASTRDRGNGYKQQFPRARDLVDSEEQEDTDNDSDYFYFCKKSKTMNTIAKGKVDKPGSVKKEKSMQVARSRVYSSQEKTKDWRRSSVVYRDAEVEKSKMVMDDTLRTLSRTITTASSTIVKCAAINNELARRDTVISNAETHITTDCQSDHVIYTPGEMSSFRGKLKRAIRKKELKLAERKSNYDSNPSSNVNLDLRGEDLGLCALSKIDYNFSSRHQIRFKAGIEQLHEALDVMIKQQKNAALILGGKDIPPNSFEKRLTTTRDKIIVKLN